MVRSPAAITGAASFEANWNSGGSVFLKVDGKLAGKAKPGILRHEPGDSIQNGANLIEAVGN